MCIELELMAKATVLKAQLHLYNNNMKNKHVPIFKNAINEIFTIITSFYTVYFSFNLPDYKIILIVIV